MNKELTKEQWGNVIQMMQGIFDYINSCDTAPTLEDKLRKEVARYRAALEKILSGLFHIGNDEHGNVFGPPDQVMCRNIAREALKEEPRGEEEK